ncbi:MAG: sigma-54-dependent Fis family transcriptional regulator [Candidatus Eisenbacteria sp.]|nr:sigma-54-dependent Fis family transcriptional regulator [Candidatus Eisenbacteria bacterium]
MPVAMREDGTLVPTVLVATEAEAEGGRIKALLGEEGLTALLVTNQEAAVNVLDSAPVDALVTRLRTPRIRGLHLLALARERNPEAAAVLIIDDDQVEQATRAMGRGVIDFQSRPLNFERLAAVIRFLATYQRRGAELLRMERRLDARFGFTGIIGGSAAMAGLVSRLKEITPSEAPVLLTGEAGSGKTLIAQVIHQNSPRRNGPFVTADCSALGGRALARRLFGAAPGGRRARRRGHIEQALGGTLLLGEIAALPTEQQGRLAEVIKTGQLRTEFSGPPVETNIRLVAASSRTIEELVGEGHFHEGLYELLAEARLDIPPLRHRRRDIATLTRHFLEAFLGKERTPPAVPRPVLDRLEAYDWPGNVRELRAVARELSEHLQAGGVLRVDALPGEIRESRMPAERLQIPVGFSLGEAERWLIEETLRRTRGNREKAAEILGIGLRTLYRKLRSYRPDAEP